MFSYPPRLSRDIHCHCPSFFASLVVLRLFALAIHYFRCCLTVHSSGGEDSTTVFNELWVFDQTRFNWQEELIFGEIPQERKDFGALRPPNDGFEMHRH